MLLYYLLEADQRFSDLRRCIPEINQRMLTLQLRELEKDGIVKRTVFPEVPPKVVYSLTPLGKTLAPVLKALEAWGNKHLTPKGAV
jgi:DNA-binding HxlR family transcriptional regulator